ncbi:hypothetical protein V6N13_005769 [Hibiscus sabdariffa]|uniref:Protein transport protein SEC23 n=1 Tax=Hibiscus sabdariffa TaxID=183260 RepID=A0ABR2EPU1_9ROSI
MKQAIRLLLEHTHVSFVSFGTQAQVHELEFTKITKIYVFKGSKEVSKEHVLEQLGLNASGRRLTTGYLKGLPNGYTDTGYPKGLPYGHTSRSFDFLGVFSFGFA